MKTLSLVALVLFACNPPVDQEIHYESPSTNGASGKADQVTDEIAARQRLIAEKARLAVENHLARFPAAAAGLRGHTVLAAEASPDQTKVAVILRDPATDKDMLLRVLDEEKVLSPSELFADINGGHSLEWREDSQRVAAYFSDKVMMFDVSSARVVRIVTYFGRFYLSLDFEHATFLSDSNDGGYLHLDDKVIMSGEQGLETGTDIHWRSSAHFIFCADVEHGWVLRDRRTTWHKVTLRMGQDPLIEDSNLACKLFDPFQPVPEI